MDNHTLLKLKYAIENIHGIMQDIDEVIIQISVHNSIHSGLGKIVEA